MKILVIGGSYFLGRVFLIQAAKSHNITVVNRGTYSVEELGVHQIKGDRRNSLIWQENTEEYDVIVDFCAYEKNDIATVLNNFSGKAKQYIFISTVDVYKRGLGQIKNENTPFETRAISGSAGEYISGKVALEQELITECEKKNINYTILRPSIIYGPFNYAPREAAFIQLAVQNKMLPHITDAEGKFQFVYVKDVANAIIKCMLNETTYKNAYNICNDTICDYDSFFNGLKAVIDIPVEELKLTVSEALAKNVPLPFPVTANETELYSNEKSIQELGLCYTSFSEGIEKTYNAFKHVFTAS
ncbi:MAG: NAD-dependent epimerase/dehydratase family protein [Lachnospiraceae bacterium]|nr:NAD-dependent epimerase/dehydratase family protein [Lachnospiraceae bacterium]